jgi:subfamily B ATP-binding cassette protein MsbA
MVKDIKRILILVKPYWGRLLVAGICSLVVSGLSGSLAWLVKPAVDKVFVSKEPGFLVLLSLGVMGAYLGRGIFSFCHSYLMRSAGAKVVRDIRNRLFSHMLYLPMSCLQRDSTGAMVSKVLNDAGFVQGLLSYTIKDLFVEGASVVVLICVALYRRWDLTLMAIIVLPAALFFVSKLSKRLKAVSRRTQEKIEEITRMLTETFSGNKIIKSFCREEDEMKRFKDRNHDFYREVMRSQRIIEGTSLMMEVVGGLGIAFVLWYGGGLVIRGEITAGDFFSFLAAIFLIYTPARRLVSATNSLHQASAPLDRIDDLLSQAKEQGGAVSLEGFSREIVFDNISFRYEGKDDDALDSVSLTVRKGEIIALVGRSGAGKTTFVDLIPRFYLPGEGRILVDGVDIATVTLKSLRSLIGIVSQDVILFNDTVRANIVYGNPSASDEDVYKAAKAAYAHDFITEFPNGYDTVVGERGVRLSGGQKQRLSIARAILKNPPILILDEATSSLDTASEIMVQRALENLMSDRTAIVIAHRLSTVRRANRIIVMERGRIVEAGSHDELLAAGGIYRKLYNLQFDDSALEHLAAEPSAPPGRAL